MSTNLYYQPVVPIEQYELPKALKYAIASRYWNHDGTLGGSAVRLTENDLEYLRGVRGAKVEGAEELISAIERFKEVDVFLIG